jgi:release factor glutamine methyltransferase
MTLHNIIRSLRTSLLTEYAADAAQALSYMLVQHFCCMTKTQILLAGDTIIAQDIILRIEDAAAALLRGTPIQYITGYENFYGCRIMVNENVLVPRPETEELVDWIIADAKDFPTANILDIGSGSGCIAVALAKNLVQTKITAWDISHQALDIARHNADINDVVVEFCCVDALAPPLSDDKWCAIVSNPPYIPYSKMSTLPQNVLCEPHLALFAPDADPILYYRAIANYAANHLFYGGRLYFEIYEYSADIIMQMLDGMQFCDIILRQDMNGKDRMLRCCVGRNK